jgi:hypothetical protein
MKRREFIRLLGGALAAQAIPANDYRQIPIDAERNGTAAHPRSHHLQSGFRASRGHILFDPIH